MGRWLFIMVPNVERILNDAYDRWARAFLGAEFWRNAAVCAHELGWLLSGFARAVLAMASQRAKWWADGGWHSQFFLKCHTKDCGWALQSSRVLSSFSVLDWPQWSSGGGTVADYRVYVKGVLLQHCHNSMSQQLRVHSQRLPYYVLEPEIHYMPAVFKALALPIGASCKLRHWCRLRCGLVALRHLGGRLSAAIFQSCVFCNARTAHPLVHCMALCPRWQGQRDAFINVAGRPDGETNQEFTVRLLSSSLSAWLLTLVIDWAAEMDEVSADFWHS
jgi:hypothetical protein